MQKKYFSREADIAVVYSVSDYISMFFVGTNKALPDLNLSRQSHATL